MGAVKAWMMDLQSMPEHTLGWNDEHDRAVHPSIADFERLGWSLDRREAYKLGRQDYRDEHQPRHGEP